MHRRHEVEKRQPPIIYCSMIRKTDLLILALMATLSMSLLSCKDDGDEVAPAKINGLFRTPYVVEIEDYRMAGAHSGQTDDLFICLSFPVLSFTNDSIVEYYQVHHKDCVPYHQQSGAQLKNETWTPVSDNWYRQGSTSMRLSYEIDNKENRLSLSDGKSFYIKRDANGQHYDCLMNEKGETVYVLASVDDERYNSVVKYYWERID